MARIDRRRFLEVASATGVAAAVSPGRKDRLQPAASKRATPGGASVLAVIRTFRVMAFLDVSRSDPT